MSFLREITTQAQNDLLKDEIQLFIGPRQAGKTTILRQLEEILQRSNESTYFLNIEDPQYLKLLNETPKNLFQIFSFDLTKKNFIFIDEVQYLKDPSHFLKFFYDEYKGKIKIFASGSSAFYLDTKFRDSLVGRKKIYYVYTLSFKEFLRFKGREDLISQSLDHVSLSEKDALKVFYPEFMIYGGYPRVVLANDPVEKVDILRDIAYSYVKKDIFEAHLRQEEIFYQLMKILASQTGQLVNSQELSSTLGVSKTAVDNYLWVMQKSFHIQLVKPFFKNIRKELTKMPKCFFMDLGLRNFLVNNFNSVLFREDKGALLENTVFRQLIQKYDREEIRFWRTTQKHEIDFIVREKMALEVKTDIHQFKEKSYKVFKESYPDVPFSLVTLDAKETTSPVNVIEAWAL